MAYKKQAPPPHIALSYSRLSTYEKCPFKFQSQYILKDYPDEGDNIHFKKGKKKHSQLENYIKCMNDPTMVKMMYDGDVIDATEIVDRLISAGFKITAEHQLAVADGFTPCTWFDRLTTFRAICDFIAERKDEAILGDWKTGKFRDYDGSKTGQLHLAAAIVFATLPHINTITTAYFYIEHKQQVLRKFTREMFENDLTIPFENAFTEVNQDSEFKATKNQYCNWCLIKDRCPAFVGE